MKELNIRYIKLHYILELQDSGELPSNKPSMLRGGIGDMLMKANCIADGNCENCQFESECVVQKTLYSKFDVEPIHVTSMNSIGYVMECENFKTDFCEGDELSFSIILFGKTIAYAKHINKAVEALGSHGIGKDKLTYRMVRILDSRRNPIEDNAPISIENLRDYVEFRKSQVINERGNYLVQLKTPVALKHNGVILEELDADVCVKAIQRRVYLLNCFEGEDADEYFQKEYPYLSVNQQEIQSYCIKRFSNRKQQEMYMRGIRGWFACETNSDEILELLLAAEIIHVGKYTSFGFGKCMVQKTK